jgi:hypothetical protein
VLLVLVLINYFFLNTKEGFSDSNPYLVGYEEGLPDEYRFLDYPKYKVGLQNMRDHIGNNWHLRFPYMVQQRYSYDDKPIDCQDTSLYGYGHLKYLPQPLKETYTCKKYPKQSYPQFYGYTYPYLTTTQYDILKRKPIYGYDYSNMYESTNNAGEATSDHYYYTDRLINNKY